MRVLKVYQCHFPADLRVCLFFEWSLRTLRFHKQMSAPSSSRSEITLARTRKRHPGFCPIIGTGCLGNSRKWKLTDQLEFEFYFEAAPLIYRTLFGVNHNYSQPKSCRHRGK